MRLIDPKKIPKMGEPTTLEDTPMYVFAQCLVDYLVENYGVDVPDIVRCKDCKHRPIPNGNDHPLAPKLDGWSDYVCPCLCDDEYYNFMPDDNDFCSRGERKDEVCCRECVHWDRTAGDVGRCTNPLKDEWAICKGEHSCAAWQRTENEK